MATRSAWATTSTWATATACAPPCSGAATATAASPAPIRPAWCCRRSWTRGTAGGASTRKPSCAAPTRGPPGHAASWRCASRRRPRAAAPRACAGPATGRSVRAPLTLPPPAHPPTLAHPREYPGVDGRHDIILCVANRSRAAQAAELELSAYGGKLPVEMLGGSAFPPIGELPYLLTLPPYGFYWFLLADATQMPAWHQPALERMPELMTLVIKRDLH